MKKIFIPLFFLVLFCTTSKAQTTSDDLQGIWTLTSLTGGDTSQVLTPEDEIARGDNYLPDFPLTTTKLNFSGSGFVYTFYTDGERSWQGTFTLIDQALTLNGVVTGCDDCEPKVINFIIRSVSANELVLDVFDEDYAKSTFAHFTFTK
jgi:hypothetical protein